METYELILLGLIFFGILLFGMGFILYAMRIMAEYEVSWELQLAIFGLIIFTLGLFVSKILSKVSMR